MSKNKKDIEKENIKNMENENIIKKYEKYQKEMMKKHKLDDWKFKWDKRSKTCGGQCNYDDKTIEVTLKYALKCSEEEYKNTLLHEIAHALVGKGHGHNDVWKKKAISIGCTGETCHTVSFTEYKYKVICKCADRVEGYHRMCKSVKDIMSNKVSCTKCKSVLKIKM